MTSGRSLHIRTEAVSLVAGHHLYPGPDGYWRVYRPGERFLRLYAADSLFRRLELALQGAALVEHVVPDADDDGAFAELLDTLEQKGYSPAPFLMTAGWSAIGLCSSKVTTRSRG